MNYKFILVYLVITVLLVLDMLCYLNWGISLRGYWSDKILLWVWLAFTLAFIVWYKNRKIAKYYLLSLIVLVILSMMPMLIPFIVMITIVTAQDVRCTQDLSSEIRIQEYGSSPVMPPNIVLIEKNLLTEKVVAKHSYLLIGKHQDYTLCDAKSIKVAKTTEDKLIIQFSFQNEKIEWDTSKEENWEY